MTRASGIVDRGRMDDTHAELFPISKLKVLLPNNPPVLHFHFLLPSVQKNDLVIRPTGLYRSRVPLNSMFVVHAHDSLNGHNHRFNGIIKFDRERCKENVRMQDTG